MAVVGEVQSQLSTQNVDSLEVITLSSDEEDFEQSVEDSSRLFDRFILVCRPHLPNEALVNARKKFKAARRHFVCSTDVVSMLKRYTEHVNKDNAVVYMESVCAKLTDERSELERQPSVAPTHNNIVGDGRRSCGNGNSDVSKARDFEEVESQNQNTTKIPTGDHSKKKRAVSDDEVDFVCEIKCKSQKDIPSTSTHCSKTNDDDVKLPKTGKISTKHLSKRQKKKLATKLKERLKEISLEIKILSKSELTLDEMEMADSNYIKENRLKKKFDKTWNKLCKILGRPPNTGRVVEKKVRASSTGYSIIDKAVEKFLNEKRGKFPNYFDIRDLVLKANDRHDLRMSQQVISGLIADIFTDIGNKLQKLREKDLLFNFGSHVLDDFKTEEDPALASEELCKQLDRNRKIGKRKLNQVYSTFAHLERHGKDGKKEWPSDTMAKEFQKNGNQGSDGSGTDDEQETSKGVNLVSSLSDEESFDSSQPCSSKSIYWNGSCSTNYVRQITSDEESTGTDSSSQTSPSNCPKKTSIETKCSSESVVLQTVNCSLLASNKGSNITVSCFSEALANIDQATSVKAESSADNGRTVVNDNCTIVIDSQDEEAVSSNLASDPVPSLACAVPVVTTERNSPNIDNSTSVIDDCQVIIDLPEKRACLSNTSKITCDTPSLSTCSVSISTNEQKSDNNSMPVLNDDCQIIIDSADEVACPLTTNQVFDTPMSPDGGFSCTVPDEQKPNIAAANVSTRSSVLNSKTSGNDDCHIIDSTSESEPVDKVRTMNTRKRKASTELTPELHMDSSTVEKVTSALRTKRLKTPRRWTKENSTEIVPRLVLNKIPTKQLPEDKEVCHERNFPSLLNGKVTLQIPNKQRQAFREKILNASTKNKQENTTMNGMNKCYEGTPTIPSTSSEITIQETSNRKNSTDATRTTFEKEECEVIVID